MSDELEPIIDGNGEERRCGLLMPREDEVSTMAAFETEFPNNVLEDADIKKLLTDPDRTPRRSIFDSEWVRKGNQGSKGSCNGWAGAMVLSKTRYLRGFADKTVLSGSYVYSWINGGRDNGSQLIDGMNELMAHGSCPMEMCGPNTIWRQDTKPFDAEAAKHRGLQCFEAQTKQGFRSGIALGFLGVVAIQVDSRFQSFKGSGILPPAGGSGNHACSVQDAKYINGTEVFDFQNNWGLGWGDQGMAWVTWDSFAQPFTVHRFYLIPSTQETGE